MAEQKRRQNQLCVVVRVDVVVYVLVGIIALLAIASMVAPERVDLTLISSLGTLLAGVLGGWLTYMRLSRQPEEEKEEDPDAAEAAKGG